jgi:flagellar motor protein MotB
MTLRSGFERIAGVIVAVCVLMPVVFAGCSSGNDDRYRQLNRQQAMTIESLNAEIVRLNQEIDGAISARAKLRDAAERLAKYLAEEVRAGDMTVSLENKGLVIRILESALFEPERIDIRSASEPALDRIADVLGGDLKRHRVIVEGHLDDALPDDSGWRSGWEYTASTAAEVLHYFTDVRGLDPGRFTVASCGEFQRIDPGDTDDGRERNRRVDVIVTSDLMGKAA